MAYGFYSPAVKDYEDLGIMKWTGTPEYDALMKIEEPYEYRDRLTMPKFIVNAAGDQYFLPDSSRFYFDDLKGEKYIRYVQNTDHSLQNSDARDWAGGVLRCVPAQTGAAEFQVEFRRQRRDQSDNRDQGDGGEVVGSNESGRARFPAGEDWTGV